MNLIVGATGNLGAEIVTQLRQKGKPARALIRDTSDREKTGRLQSAGAELITGDLKQPESIAAAVRGVTTVISTATSVISQQPGDTFDAVDSAGLRRLIDAAAAAGVKHFIFVSVSGGIKVPSPLVDAKRGIEEHLRACGIAFTILRPSAFMETWLGPMAGFDVAGRKATVLGDGNQRISYVALRDVAALAVACVDNAAARNRTIEVGGPRAITQRDAIRLFEEASGSTFEVQEVPTQALEAQNAAATDPVPKSFAALMLQLSRNDEIPMDATAREFGLKLRSVDEFVQESVSASAPPAR